MDSPTAQRPISFESAAAHATRNIPIFSSGESAQHVRRQLEGRAYESLSLMVVYDGDTFRGVVRIEDLMAAPPAVTLDALMDRDPPVVAPGIDQEIAAWQAVRHGESSLVVLDSQRQLVGVIPPQRLLAVMLTEHEEDLSRLGGFTQNLSTVRAASEEPVDRRFRHRVPWLLVGLFGALLAADLVGWFESELEHTVILAFFVPGIVYLADAVGTQTETVVVRGLSVGVPMQRMMVRELLTGLAIGLALSLVATPVVWWRWGDRMVALAVGCAVFAACSTATIAAMLLPWLLDRFHIDPAFGSGPLATVIQDLLSILIYFAIATALMA